MPRVYASNSQWAYEGTESIANASYMWAYFKAKGWSNSAIAGLIGNTTHESYNNPGYHERGGGGFGIVQWTPSRNYINWARPRGFPVDGDYSDPERYLLGQCERIIYEVNTGIEFLPNSRYGYNWTGYRNWESYIHNTLTPAESAWLFMSNYERPDYGAANASRQARQTYAQHWYDMFATTQGSSHPKQQTAAHAAAQWAIGIANNTQEYNGYTDHGYDQDGRWGERGDFDCSALVITAYDVVKPELQLKAHGATYTGDMRAAMISRGFYSIDSQVNFTTGSGLIEGDVLINTVHHAAIYVGDGKLVEARINEKNTVRGGKPGDQTGEECWVRPYYNRPWNHAIRYDGMTVFGSVGSGTGVSIVSATPITKTNWADNPERNG